MSYLKNSIVLTRNSAHLLDEEVSLKASVYINLVVTAAASSRSSSSNTVTQWGLVRTIVVASPRCAVAIGFIAAAATATTITITTVVTQTHVFIATTKFC